MFFNRSYKKEKQYIVNHFNKMTEKDIVFVVEGQIKGWLVRYKKRLYFVLNSWIGDNKNEVELINENSIVEIKDKKNIAKCKSWSFYFIK